MSNAFCHMELNSNDPDKAKEFYGEMFDWEFKEYPMEEGVYLGISTGKDPGGGLFKNPVPEVPSHWLVYIEVDDINASTSKAKELGAIVHKEVTPIPEMGFFSVIQDPTGAVVALWQNEKK